MLAMKPITLKIPRRMMVRGGDRPRLLPPALNQRMHWRVRALWTAAFRRHAWQLCLEEHVPPLPRAKVTVTHHAVRPMDRDNLFGACKPLIDGIVDAGVIPDDSPEFIRQECESVRVGKRAEERVEITIEKLP